MSVQSKIVYQWYSYKLSYLHNTFLVLFMSMKWKYQSFIWLCSYPVTVICYVSALNAWIDKLYVFDTVLFETVCPHISTSQGCEGTQTLSAKTCIV